MVSPTVSRTGKRMVGMTKEARSVCREGGPSVFTSSPVSSVVASSSSSLEFAFAVLLPPGSTGSSVDVPIPTTVRS